MVFLGSFCSIPGTCSITQGQLNPLTFLFLPTLLPIVRAGIDFALRETQINKENIKEERQLENIFKEISTMIGRGRKIGTELDVLPANRFSELRKIFNGFKIVDISPLILDQRKKKDNFEIKTIKKACTTIHRGHERVLSVLREGMTELELAAAVEDTHRLAGHEGIFFIRQPDFFMSRGPLASGSNLYQISGVSTQSLGSG